MDQEREKQLIHQQMEKLMSEVREMRLALANRQYDSISFTKAIKELIETYSERFKDIADAFQPTQESQNEDYEEAAESDKVAGGNKNGKDDEIRMMSQ